MIVGGAREGHKNCWLAGRRHLGHRAGPGAADEQICPRKQTRHIVDKAIELNGAAQIRVGRLSVIIVTFAGLMDDVNSRNTLTQVGYRIHDHLLIACAPWLPPKTSRVVVFVGCPLGIWKKASRT